MFFWKDVTRSLRRYGLKSFIAALTAGVLSCFLFLFSISIDARQRQLNQLALDTELRLTFVNTSGTRSTGLIINDQRLQQVEQSGLAERGFYAATALFQDGTEDDGSFVANDRWPTQLMASYTDESPLENLVYFEGYDSAIFHSTDPVCLLSADKFEKMGLSPGQEISLTLFTFRESQGAKGVFYGGETTFRVAGIYDSPGTVFTGMEIPVVCPYDSLRAALNQLNLNIWPSQAYMTILRPENLNPLKELLSEVGIQPVDKTLSTYANYGNTAVINDSLYIGTAEPTQRALTLLRSLYPPALAAVALITLLAAYLLVQSRREEIALSQSLGVGRLRLCLSLLTESLLQSLAGIAAALAVFAVFSSLSLPTLFGTAAGCLASSLLGSALAALLAARPNVLASLSSQG